MASADTQTPVAKSSVADARELVERALVHVQVNPVVFQIVGHAFDDIASVHVSATTIDIGTSKHGVFQCPLKVLGEIHKVTEFTVGFSCSGTAAVLSFWNDGTDVANRVVRVLSVLQQAALAEDPAWQVIVTSYRTAAKKPELPEEAHKFDVQALDAVSEKRFQQAADLYHQVLIIAPWWPGGHFNLALVLSDIGDFEGAVNEMQRYLALVPEAPDGRAAQDKVYVWQRKM